MKTRFLMLLAAVLLSMGIQAHDALVNGIYYNLNQSNKTATVTYKGNNISSRAYSGAVVIPASIEYEGTSYEVTRIGNYAFYNCSDMTSGSIPCSITSIGIHAFQGCSSLKVFISFIDEPFIFGYAAFDDIYSQCLLLVSHEKKDEYIEKGWTTNIFGGGVVDALPQQTTNNSNNATCDVNGDGEVNISDVTMLVNVILGKIDIPSHPDTPTDNTKCYVGYASAANLERIIGNEDFAFTPVNGVIELSDIPGYDGCKNADGTLMSGTKLFVVCPVSKTLTKWEMKSDGSDYHTETPNTYSGEEGYMVYYQSPATYDYLTYKFTIQ